MLSHLYQQFFLCVPDHAAPPSPPLPPPPPHCLINQSNLLNVVLCMRMHIGEKMCTFRSIRTISAAVQMATLLLMTALLYREQVCAQSNMSI